MPDLLPDGEDLRRAVRWVSERLKEDDPPPAARLVQEAVFRFDLSPRDAEFLGAFYRKATSPG